MCRSPWKCVGSDVGGGVGDRVRDDVGGDDGDRMNIIRETRRCMESWTTLFSGQHQSAMTVITSSTTQRKTTQFLQKIKSSVKTQFIGD